MAENEEIQIKGSAKAIYALIGLLSGGLAFGGLFHFGVPNDNGYHAKDYVTHEELEKVLRQLDKDTFVEKMECEKSRNIINQRLHSLELDRDECKTWMKEFGK